MKQPTLKWQPQKKPTEKARINMTADTNTNTQYKAGGQYAKGDPGKGKGDPKEVAVFGPSNTIAHRDRRAYLEDQALKNQSANDELQAKQVEANKKLGDLMVEALDPDKLRDESTKAALEEVDRHTEEYVAAARENRQTILRTVHLRAGGFSPSDSFIAGAPAAPETAAASQSRKQKAEG
jgi:hypothetical protein